MTAVLEQATGYASELPPVTPLHVTACGIVSAAGIGTAALAAVLAGAAPHEVPEPGEGEPYPERAVRSVPPFDAYALLGRKGTRNLDRLTRLGLIATDDAVASLPGGLPAERDRTGVVVGTTTGSITTTTDVGRDTFVHDRPYMVNPATFPNTVMNTCGGQIAIRNGLLGVNAALSGGKVSGLLAIRYARIALGRRRADRLIVGAVEEVTARTAWAWHRTGVLSPSTPLGEGAAVALLQRPGAEPAGAPLAELLGCEVGYFGGSRPGPAAGLARCITTALSRSGLGPSDVDVVAPGASGHVRLAGAERRALARTVGAGVDVFDVVPVLGECYSASTSMQLAALIARRRPGVGLVTTVGFDGNVGALVVRLPGRN